MVVSCALLCLATKLNTVSLDFMIQESLVNIDHTDFIDAKILLQIRLNSFTKVGLVIILLIG